VLDGVARVLRPGGRFELLVSVTDRDHGAGSAPLDAESLAKLRPVYAAHGLDLEPPRPATAAEVAATRSTWGRRLGAGTTRPAWCLGARKAAR
jgi:16S rRNA (adenine(1408)-N(1))-methyltransferase